MASHASRVAKLELRNADYTLRVILLGEGETETAAWQRYIVQSGIDADASIQARATGRVMFMSWTDSKL